ncbi:MAG: type II toxin-antitoxin system HicA family toxin [Turicibacter sp.]|nr:type II toxin-antitoxin system HicA family toxin [Turicibacter sp.]
MSQKDKLIRRLKSKPRDMTFDEVETLLSLLGFKLSNQGKTSGSSVKFINVETKGKIAVHKPHPSNVLKLYHIVKTIKTLENEGLI